MKKIAIGKALRVARAREGITQEKLATKSRVARNYISRIERDNSSPSIEVLERLCHSLRIKVSEFVAEAEAIGDK